MNPSLAAALTQQPNPRVERSHPASPAFRQTHISPAALVGVTLAHAGLLGLLVFMPKAPEPLTPPRPLMVSLVQPKIEAPRPEPQPTQPVVKPVVKPPPVRAATPAPAPLPRPVIEASEPTPAPVAEVSPPPAPAIEVAQAAPSPAQPATPAHPADYLANPKPPYPALSKRLGEEGTVRLNILVTPDGSVAQLELLESSGHPRLDRSAMATVRSQWKFEPARQGGRAVAAWVVVPIQFTLRS
ncbi:MAG: energy transducer TonB [Thiobacillus sp.]|jgi:protein TonB